DREALREFAAQLEELDRIRVSLGAFRHNVHPEIVRQRDDGAQDHRPLALARGAHERLIDLDRVEREPLQIAERGMAGAEVVERQPGAKLANGVSICAACSGFSITMDSVSSSLSVPRARPERAITVRRSWIRSCRSSCRDDTLTLAKIGSRLRT